MKKKNVVRAAITAINNIPFNFSANMTFEFLFVHFKLSVNLFHFDADQKCSVLYHGWPSTQPRSLHTAVQRKYTQPCSLFSRGTAVWTMGHGCVQVPGCVEGHPCICNGKH